MISIIITKLADFKAMLGRVSSDSTISWTEIFDLEGNVCSFILKSVASQNVNLCLPGIVMFYVAKHKAFVLFFFLFFFFFSPEVVFFFGGFADLSVTVTSERWRCFAGVAKVILWDGNALVICCEVVYRRIWMKFQHPQQGKCPCLVLFQKGFGREESSCTNALFAAPPRMVKYNLDVCRVQGINFLMSFCLFIILTGMWNILIFPLFGLWFLLLFF